MGFSSDCSFEPFVHEDKYPPTKMNPTIEELIIHKLNRISETESELHGLRAGLVALEARLESPVQRDPVPMELAMCDSEDAPPAGPISQSVQQAQDEQDDDSKDARTYLLRLEWSVITSK